MPNCLGVGTAITGYTSTHLHVTVMRSSELLCFRVTTITTITTAAKKKVHWSSELHAHMRLEQAVPMSHGITTFLQ